MKILVGGEEEGGEGKAKLAHADASGDPAGDGGNTSQLVAGAFCASADSVLCKLARWGLLAPPFPSWESSSSILAGMLQL